MKTYRPDARPDPLRRKLMLAFPGGLVAATPLALLGCGGGGDAAEATLATPRDPLLDLPPGDASATSMRVQVVLPAALGGAAGLQILSATGAAPVTAGEATVEVLADGPQLATVVTADGTPVLMGWVGPNRPPISVQTTAAVLLHFGLGLPFHGPAARDTLRQRLEAHAAVGHFGDRIANALAADTQALALMPQALMDAFDTAAQQLLPGVAAAPAASRRRAQGLVVEPAIALSGLQVVQGDVLNTCFVDNIYVRRAVVIVNREAWFDSAGQRHAEPQAPVQVGEVMELPLPAAIDSVANTVGGWASEYYAPDDPNGFFRSVSDSVTLDITPADAKRTEYSVVVLMAGSHAAADAALFARLPPSQQAYLRGFDLSKHLMLKTLLIDLVGPFFFGMLAEKLGEFAKGKSASEARKELMTSFAATLFAILQNRVPDLIQRVSDGSLDAWGAFKLIGRALTVDTATGEMSPLLTDCLGKLAEFCVARLADAKLRSPLLEVITGLKVGGKNVLGILPVLRILQKFDEGLGYAALLRICADAQRSREMESWRITATRAKVALRPDPIEVETTGVSYPVTAEIVDNDDDEYGIERGSIKFEWECSGRYGKLYSRADTGLATPNRFTTSKDFATTDYLPSGMEPDPAAPETITVRAYFEPIGSSGAPTLIGTASSTLKFKKAFSLRITPAMTELPTDVTLGLNAALVGKLSPSTSVRYEWKLRSGGGALNISGADGDPRSSYVDYQAPADETTAVVECVAVVTVDPTLLPVRTDPVTSTIAVKKGVKTLTFAGGWTIEAVYAAASSSATAYVVVPKVSGATRYSVRLTNTVSHPATSPANSNRDFTPPPPPGSHWQDRGGAYWSGLSSGGGPADWADAAVIPALTGAFSGMTVTVTVTLP